VKPVDFWSPSKGRLSLQEVAQDLMNYLDVDPSARYRVIIGTDSQNRLSQGRTTFATAIIVHRVGRGAKYYFHRKTNRLVGSLRQRLYMEASMSLEVCAYLQEALSKLGEERAIEVHLDIGEQGESRQLIREVVGWVTSSGFTAKIKPDSFAASKVADRYTKA
jgi:predicted RNase H-related nuclease YkuK (DUF458 family)